MRRRQPQPYRRPRSQPWRGRGGRRAERGLASVELVVVAPAFVLFVLLVVFAGRVALAEQAVAAAASEAARGASLARDAATAGTQARSWASTGLANEGLRCRSHDVAVDTGGFAVPVGQPAQVNATVTCVLDLRDLAGLPGMPGVYTATATMSSPLDTYRERGAGT